MGIPQLNRYIIGNCKRGVYDIDFSDVSGKVIAIDILIYLYKFASEDLLMENLYMMISLFRYYNITPIFVFDGKPPAEKSELLQQRADEKLVAEQEYEILKQKLETSSLTSENNRIQNKMKILRKKSVKINRYTIALVKEFIEAYGMVHYTAEGEADPFCAQLVKKNYAWACLSEDMDQFVYGTPRILRYLNLSTETMCVYNLKKILCELKIPYEDFKDICILSGTDYNLSNTTNLYKSLRLYTRFIRSKKPITFYEWLTHNTNYIDDINLLQHTKHIFDTTISLANIQKKNIKTHTPKWDRIKQIMKPYGYIILHR